MISHSSLPGLLFLLLFLRFPLSLCAFTLQMSLELEKGTVFGHYRIDSKIGSEIWKDADADMPALVAAKQEYARLLDGQSAAG